MYVVIKNSTKSKSYMTTDDCNKPYLELKDGARTPLTTNTTNGFYINIKGSSSHSESASYLTSNTESSGMSSVTALTSEVVDTYYSSKADSAGLSSTTALTRESTSGYLTRSSTSGYGTKTVNTKPSYQSAYRTTFAVTQRDVMGDSYTATGYQTRTASQSDIVYTIGGAVRCYRYITSVYGSGMTGNSPGMHNTSVYAVTTASPYATYSPVYVSKQVYVATATVYTITETVTTATLTRESTYSTLTCESTSGYSGVSSSSSESTSGYTGYSSSETTVINSALMRPMEYVNDISTWYTSALNSEGLSETTALTRESTSDTIYETRSSTSGTSYGTKNEAYSLCTTSYNGSFLYDTTSVSGSMKVLYDKKTAYTINGEQAYRVELLNTTDYKYFTFTSIVDGYVYYTSLSYNNQGQTKHTESHSSSKNGNTSYYTNFENEEAAYYGGGYTSTQSRKATYGKFDSIVTTGTTYLTRSSTSNTIYLTCSSTSGYSGISSSGSTAWK